MATKTTEPAESVTPRPAPPAEAGVTNPPSSSLVDGPCSETRSPLLNIVRGCRPRWTTVAALLVGLLLGAAGLATFQASGTVPPPPVGGNLAAETDSDFVLSVREPYLTRMAAQQAAAIQGPVPFENVRVNILPGQQLRLLADIRFMGQRFELSTLMTVGVVNRRIQLQAGEAQLGTLVLPVDLQETLAQPINRELAQLFDSGQFDVLDVATATDRLIVRLVEKRPAGPSR
jgi:hypothetical protein